MTRFRKKFGVTTVRKNKETTNLEPLSEKRRVLTKKGKLKAIVSIIHAAMLQNSTNRSRRWIRTLHPLGTVCPDLLGIMAVALLAPRGRLALFPKHLISSREINGSRHIMKGKR